MALLPQLPDLSLAISVSCCSPDLLSEADVLSCSSLFSSVAEDEEHLFGSSVSVGAAHHPPQSVLDVEQLPVVRCTKRQNRGFQCDECGESFKRRTHFDRHVKAVHRKVFPFPCDVCCRGFSDKTHHAAHMKAHSFEETALRPALRFVHGENDRLCVEVQALRIAAARLQLKSCTDERCAVSSSRASADLELQHFKCFSCQNATHLTCVDYSIDMIGSQCLLCVACLRAQALPLHACILDHNAATLLKHYLRADERKTVFDIPLDGACLLRSILAASRADGVMPSGKDVCVFLREVVQTSEGLQLAFPDVCVDVQRLNTTSLLAKLRTLWDSAFFDDFVFHAAVYIKRDVYVFTCISSEILRSVIPCKCDPVGAPVCVMRSGLSVRYDHYTAVY
jgi:hypothetical protein